MAELKTRLTGASVPAFIKAIPDPVLSKDAAALSKMMSEATGKPAVMWGTAIIGYGLTPYVGANGKSGDWMTMGFSPRSSGLVIYMMGALAKQPAVLEKLGKAKLKGGCLHIKRLSDVDLPTLGKVLATVAKARRAS